MVKFEEDELEEAEEVEVEEADREWEIVDKEAGFNTR